MKLGKSSNSDSSKKKLPAYKKYTTWGHSTMVNWTSEISCVLFLVAVVVFVKGNISSNSANIKQFDEFKEVYKNFILVYGLGRTQIGLFWYFLSTPF